MNHRAGDGDLFLTDRDRQLFLRLMQEASEEAHVEILEYCLMPNHCHLIVHCPFGTLDKFMHHLQGNYARAFNCRHDRKGPVFQNRYHNVLITSDEQFQTTCRYVNRNPGELGFDIATYAWSSFAHHTTETCAAHALVNVDQEMIHSMFGSAAAYVDFVKTHMAHDKFRLPSVARVVHIDAMANAEHDLDEVCTAIARTLGTTKQSIRSSSRGQRNDARLIATLLLDERFPAEIERICSNLGYRSTSTFRTALRRARVFCESDEGLARQLETARRALAPLLDQRAA